MATMKKMSPAAMKKMAYAKGEGLESKSTKAKEMKVGMAALKKMGKKK